MSRTISVIRGDGIGPEIMQATLRVLDALDCGLEYEFVDAGLAALDRHGNLLPEPTLESIRRNRVALKGPLTTPVGQGFRSINVTLRELFDLYADESVTVDDGALFTRMPPYRVKVFATSRAFESDNRQGRDFVPPSE